MADRDEAERQPEPRAHTVPETAIITRLSRSTIYTLIRDGVIRPVYVGGRTLIPDEEIDRFLADASRERTHHRGRQPQVAAPPSQPERRQATKPKTGRRTRSQPSREAPA